MRFAQIRREREFMSAWLPFADALAVADAVCEAAEEDGGNEFLLPLLARRS